MTVHHLSASERPPEWEGAGFRAIEERETWAQALGAFVGELACWLLKGCALGLGAAGGLVLFVKLAGLLAP